MTTVSVIIPSFNGRHLLGECLSSLQQTDVPAICLDIIVVDNGSDDGSRDYIKDNFPAVHIIKNPENLGFAEACNIGAMHASGDYIVFLNNDTKVDGKWLTSLLDGLDRGKSIICTSSRIVGWDENITEFGGGEINFCGYGFQRSSFKKKYLPLEEPAQIPFACGCSMLIDRNVFIDCGMFDKDYFAFYEDVDLGWRLNLQGYKIHYCPDSVVHHHHHATAKKMKEGFLYFLWSRNALLNVIKNYENNNLPRVFTCAILLTVERFIYISGLRNKAVELGMTDEASRYLDIQEGIGKAVIEIFENMNGILEKRKFVQERRKISDRELSDNFELRIEFDDIINAKAENILSSHLMNMLDFSDIFKEGRQKEHSLETINTLKKAYKETLSKAVDFEHKNNLLEHRVCHLENREKELASHNVLLQNEIGEIKNSKTFKILRKIRTIRGFLKREK